MKNKTDKPILMKCAGCEDSTELQPGDSAYDYGWEMSPDGHLTCVGCSQEDDE